MGVSTISDESSQDFNMQLDAALVTRPVIEQAKGVIIGAVHCTADEAFAQLVSTSQHHNIKLHDVAVAVVALASGTPTGDRRSEELALVVRSRWGDLSPD